MPCAEASKPTSFVTVKMCWSNLISQFNKWTRTRRPLAATGTGGATTGDGTGDGDDNGDSGGDGKGVEVVDDTRPRRFYGSAHLDTQRLGRDARKIGKEILSHLTGLPGVRSEITLDIQIETSECVPDNNVRTVAENFRTLKFDSQGFEQSLTAF